ncbi:MAG: helix-turn-helix transcriptional regulator [Oscillospiraceae bacterium]|nr:helix-turn-helix transcriptional regulator [Oscillospiraceae bacterium]
MEYCPIKFIHMSVGSYQPFSTDNLLLNTPKNIDILPPPELAMHNHPYYSITYVLNCTDDIRYIDGYKTGRLCGHIYIETPQTLHSSKNQLAGFGSGITIWFVCHDTAFMKKIGNDALFLKGTPELKHVFDELINYAKSVSSDAGFLSKKTYELISEIFSAHNPQPVIDKKVSKPENEFAGLIKYISTHLDCELSLSDLEKQAHMSHAHFSRKFKQVFNITPMNYLYALRLHRSLDELICTTAPIEYIAKKTGFKNVSAFCTAFRRAYGYSPSEYREKFIRERGLFHDARAILK